MPVKLTKNIPRRYQKNKTKQKNTASTHDTKQKDLTQTACRIQGGELENGAIEAMCRSHFNPSPGISMPGRGRGRLAA